MTKFKSRSIPKLPSEQAAAKLILLGCKNSSDFIKLCASRGEFAGKSRPDDVPSSPIQFYEEVTSWVDFFQTGRDYLVKNHIFDKVPTLAELREICIRQQIDTRVKYKDAVRRGWLGVNAPTNPEHYYGPAFTWKKLLADKNLRWWSFDEARAYMRQYDLKTINDWRDFCRKGLRPKGIPSIPATHYNEFTSWAHFLGAED